MSQSYREIQSVGMDSTSSDSSQVALRSDSDFGFAFNNSNFSDRDLRIEIVPDLPDFKNDADCCTSIADWARNRKRRREDIRKDASEAKVERILNCHMPETDDAAAYENQDLMPVAMIEGSPTDAGMNSGRLGMCVFFGLFSSRIIYYLMFPMIHCDILSKNRFIITFVVSLYTGKLVTLPYLEGDEAVAPSDTGALTSDAGYLTSVSALAMDCSAVFRVETLHISSLLLAAKSPFFYKLFSNGMRESDERHVTLRIHASEKEAFIDLLNFMYSRKLSATTPTALLDVLMAADKFEVASCMRYCSKLLRNLPMTCESALLYLDIPSTVLMAEAVQPLTDAAKIFLATHYKDISKCQEEVLNLPLAGIEAVLSSDDLQIASEDAVYDFVLKWARIHYPKLEDRQAILGSRLGRLVRFPYMTCRKLKKVLSCNDFDPDLTSKVVLEALFFKAEPPYRQRSLAAEEESGSHHRFVERAYKYRPVKVVEFEVPHQQCIVYLNLKRDECAHMFPSGRVYSQAFHLGGQGFFLSAHCNMDQQSSSHCFGLFLGMQDRGSVSFTVEYDFAAWSEPLDDYMSKYKGSYTFTGGKAVGYRNLFGIPWTLFVSDESLYFINDVLHLRTELTIRR